MEQNIFIPGDWVKYNGITVQVIGSRLNFSLLSDIIYTDKEPWIMNSEIQGIPLLPEILEKNGWKKGTYGYWTNGDVCISENRNGAFSFDCCNIDIALPYVHSLQHLLFGLGLNSEMEV